MLRLLEGSLKLESEAPESLQWKLTVKEGKNHESNAIVGYMDGLEFVFEKQFSH